MSRCAQRIALAIWTIAFLIGAFNHARALVAGGWLPYRFAPLGCNVFWTALLPIDIAVVILLWTRRVIGVWLGIAVMFADVTVNSWFSHSRGFPELTTALQLQSLFLGFVLGSSGWLLSRESDR